MSVSWDHVETNRPSSDLTVAAIIDCSFGSTDPFNLFPDTFDAEDFQETQFIYDTFGFINTGSGTAVWSAIGYNYGILNTLRDGIGFFYFYTAVPPFSYDEDTVGDDGCYEVDFTRIHFWNYLSTFWNFLDNPSRDMVENMWFGMVIAGGSLVKKAARFLAAVSPTTVDVCQFEDYYDLQLSPMLSRPVYLDPTQKAPKTIINPIGTILVEPEYTDLVPSFHDLIEITGDDYHKVRNLGVRVSGKINSECYVIVQPKSEDIGTKYFKVTDFYSSEEANDRPASAVINRYIITEATIAAESLTQSDLDAMGALKLTGDDGVDISQKKITISYDASTTVAWTTDELTITVVKASAAQIADVLAAVATGTPWATISNASPSGTTKVPIIDNVDFEDLYSYINASTDGGRYYPDSGKVWKFFSGYSVSNGDTVGDETKGEWVDSLAKYKYVVEVEGSLEYLGVEEFSIYFTTGKSYDINKEVLSLPYLNSGIEIDGINFVVNTDYTFIDHVVEFVTDPFVIGGVSVDDYLYCKKAPIIENYLFEQHGGMVGVDDWTQYNYRNISGKAALNTLQSSLRNISSLAEYEKALNVYYGLPVSPEKCKVVGLFESYGYKVLDISGLTVTLEIKDGEEIHPFVQPQCVMINNVGTQYVITGMVTDRTLGKVTLNNVTGITYGDRMHVRLNNRFTLKNIYAETSSTPAYVDAYIREGFKPIKHVIDTVNAITGRWPELIIHGTDKLAVNYDGLYHATDAYTHPSGDPSLVRIELYKPDTNEDPIYNDYIGTDTVDIQGGFAHFPWPTHKFLYLYMIESDKLYRAYMDAPMDTVYDSGDNLAQYQIICRNASVLNGALFDYWNQYRNFRRSPDINTESDIVEMIFADPSGVFGQHFPSRYLEAE